MKKYLIILLALFMATPCFGYARAANARATFRNGYAWSGHPSKDLATQWAQGIEGQAEVGGRLGTGSVWYVDSGVSASGSGTSWTDAVSTLDAIFALITSDGGASRGDWVMVAEGHNEGGSTAAIFDADVIGVTVEGKGVGSLKPTFDFDGATATCAIGADNVTLINLRFRASTTTVKGEIAQNDLTRALTVDAGADYAHIISCDFGFRESSGDEFLYALVIGAATGTVVEDCFFDSGEEAAAAAIVFAGSDLTVLRNNKIIGDYTIAGIYSATTTNQRLAYEYNELWNGVHSGLNTLPVVSLKAEDTGISRHNEAYCNVSTVGAAFVGAKVFHTANYYNEDVAGTKTSFAFDTASTTAGTGTSITVSGDD
ncbi:hypothetical protein LCGC14_1070810 [marine sediment metagenome]|uniref:Right handed beta helix domain-containing protein n=1 Tax=marine sediment metagenome TaxID=412755 RepID=A0A0F9Q1C0_9ZZZZ